MLEYIKSTRAYKWVQEHKWAKRGLLAFLIFQGLKSIAWTIFFIMLWLGYTHR